MALSDKLHDEYLEILRDLTSCYMKRQPADDAIRRLDLLKPYLVMTIEEHGCADAGKLLDEGVRRYMSSSPSLHAEGDRELEYILNLLRVKK
jgi:hypothetical protein